MIIISKFRDYYDTALAYGHDDSYRYIRNSETSQVEKPDIFDFSPDMSHQGYRSFPLLLGFCGSYYPAFHIQYGYGLNPYTHTFWSFDELEDYINRIRAPYIRRTEQKGWNKERYWWALQKRATKKEIFELFFSKGKHITSGDTPFFEYGTPIFLIQRTGRQCELTTNPKLKDYEFYKAIPPQQAFQSIDMFLSGVLGSAHPPMASISDLSMRDKKGFDDWSFKTRPTKRRT